MWRLLVVVSVVFLNIRCGNIRHHNIEWPASLIGIVDFSAEQHERVMLAIDEFNSRVNKKLIITSNAETNSTILIKWSAKIPRLATTIAGRATVNGDECTVDLANVVASSDELTKPVLWHELGHCAGLDHDPTKGEIMYKEAFPLSDLDPAAIDRFFSQLAQATAQ